MFTIDGIERLLSCTKEEFLLLTQKVMTLGTSVVKTIPNAFITKVWGSNLSDFAEKVYVGDTHFGMNFVQNVEMVCTSVKFF